MSLRLLMFLELTIFVTFIYNSPVVKNGQLNIEVNMTNYHQRNISTDRIITNSVSHFQPLELPIGEFVKNDVKYGNCDTKKYIVHNENIQIENVGPSTMSGVIEIYIDSPIKINCVEVIDKMPPGTGATVSLKDGGPGYNWLFLNYQGKYARGINIIVVAYGVPDYTKLIFKRQ